MDVWHVWECNQCGSTLTINYDANDDDYNRIKNCGCKFEGVLEWKHNYNDVQSN